MLSTSGARLKFGRPHIPTYEHTIFTSIYHTPFLLFLCNIPIYVYLDSFPSWRSTLTQYAYTRVYLAAWRSGGLAVSIKLYTYRYCCILKVKIRSTLYIYNISTYSYVRYARDIGYSYMNILRVGSPPVCVGFSVFAVVVLSITAAATTTTKTGILLDALEIWKTGQLWTKKPKS